MAQDKGADSEPGTAIHLQASLLEDDLRKLVGTLHHRLILLDGVETETHFALRTAKEAAEQALGLAKQLRAIAATREQS